MSEYKSFFLTSKLIVNIFFPLFLLRKENNIFISYASTIIFFIIVLSYIYWKKRLYFKSYLCRTYIPSMKLILFVHTVDFILLFFLYYTIGCSGNREWLYYTISISHVLISTCIYLIIYSQRERNKSVIAYTRHKYKLAIIARDINKFLKMGQPVEIIQDIPGGYIVRNCENEDYEIKLDDVETILNVV